MPLYVIAHYHIHDAGGGEVSGGPQRGTGGRGGMEEGVKRGKGWHREQALLWHLHLPGSPESSERSPGTSHASGRRVPDTLRPTPPYVASHDAADRPTENLLHLTFRLYQGRCELRPERRRRDLFL